MASVKYSSIVTDARGSVGGVTFSRARGGAYARSRVTPINPQTSRRAQVRGSFAAIAQSWQALSSTQRESWDLYAEETPSTNRLGETFFPSGFNRYVGANQLIGLIGGSPIVLAPSTPGLGPSAEISYDTVSVDQNSVVFDTISFAEATGSDLLLFQIGGVLSAGAGAYYGPYVALTYPTPPATVTAVTASASFQGTGLVTGQRRPFRVQVVTVDGKVGVPYEFIGTLS